MKERINTLLHNFSLVILVSLILWYFLTPQASFPRILTIMIAALATIEIVRLIIVSKVFPESHTTFKVGVIAGLCILLGIKSMLPSFFVPLTLMLMAVNSVYDFYSDAKRKKVIYKEPKNRRTK